MRIGLLGTGKVATALGQGFAAHGHDVVLGSRHPAERAGHPLPVTDLAGAARHGELVVNATPGLVTLDTLAAVGAPALAGKVLIDVALAVTADRQLAYPNSSLAEQIQAGYPHARVVKTLSTVNTALMTNPGALGAPSTVFLSGDDPAAKATVAGLLTELGWAPEDQVDLGDISTARGPEHLVPLLLALFRSLGTTELNLRVVRASDQ